VSLLKSVSDATHRLDSTITYEMDDETNELSTAYKEQWWYNQQGVDTLNCRYKWNIEDECWDYSYKSKSLYTTDGRRIYYESNYWNEDGAYWKGNSKYVTIYDDTNLSMEFFSYTWIDSLQQWEYWARSQEDYDLYGNTIMEEMEYWNTDLQKWYGDYGLSKHNEQEYDADGNVIQKIYFQWDTTSFDWINSTLQVYEYDTQNRNTLSERSVWNLDDNQWDKDYKSECEYDSLGNLTLNARFDVDSVGEWTETQQKIMSYFYFPDTVCLETSEWVNWDTDSLEWYVESRDVYEYDDYANLIMHTQYYFYEDLDSLIASRVYKYQYDFSSNLLYYVYSIWDDDNNIWENQTKEEYEYDANNRNTIKELYRWNEDSWSGKDKIVYTYDADTIITINYTWDDEDNNWMAESKEESCGEYNQGHYLKHYYEVNELTRTWDGTYGYESYWDEYGINTSNLEHCWDEVVDNWYVCISELCSVDYSVAGDYIIWAEDSPYKIDESQYWECLNDETDLTLYQNEIYYYTTLSTNSNSIISDSELVVFPNPASDYLEIDNAKEYSSIKIFNTNGNVVLNDIITANQIIDISILKEGIYVYCLTGYSGVQNGKLIIKR
jgi:hypothetical protein